MKIVFALSLIAAGALLAADTPEQVTKIKSLQQELVKTLQSASDTATALAGHGRLSHLEAARVQQAAFQAMLDAAETKDERIKILEQIIAVHKRSEEVAQHNHHSAQGTKLEFFKARAATIEAQIALEKELASSTR